MSSNSNSTAPTTSASSLSLTSLFGVAGKRVVVTGGGSGLGSYAALGLALNGARVFIVGRREEKLKGVKEDFEKRREEKEAPEAAKRGEVVVLPGDVSSKEGLHKLVADYSKHEDGLEVLINGAGISGDMLKLKPEDKDNTDKVHPTLLDEEWSTWTSVLHLNTVSPWFTTLAFVPLLSKSRSPPSLRDEGPCVLLVTSIAGHHISRSNAISHSYQVSKDAEEKVAKLLAVRLQPYRIRVNAVAPGIYPSEMTNHPTPESFSDQAKKMVPYLQRSGTPEDFAGLILFLASRAGAYLNGSSIVTDGGRLLVSSGV